MNDDPRGAVQWLAHDSIARSFPGGGGRFVLSTGGTRSLLGETLGAGAVDFHQANVRRPRDRSLSD